MIAIYNEILEGKRRKFPTGFWQNNGEEKARVIYSYLFKDILSWDANEAMEGIDYELFAKYRITTPFNIIYKQSYRDTIITVYPEASIGKRLPHRAKTRKKLSASMRNLSPEKRNNITKGMRRKRYTEEYAKKLSDTKLGEVNPQHKLISNQVLKIKKLWAEGNYSTAKLGEMFGVKRQTIADIVYGRTWKHI